MEGLSQRVSKAVAGGRIHVPWRRSRVEASRGSRELGEERFVIGKGEVRGVGETGSSGHVGEIGLSVHGTRIHESKVLDGVSLLGVGDEA